MRHLTLIIFLSFGIILDISAQELKCQVQVMSQIVQGQGVDDKVFKTLETSIREFLNNRRWTEDNFSDEEKIDCNLVISITKINSPTQFKATLEIQARRPIYNSSYNSIIFNYKDNNFQFNYQENQALEYSENTYLDNLTSVLGFYANFIIGLDYDSFSLNGGDPHFQRALNTVNSVSGEFAGEWTSGTSNRYWMINNMFDATFIPLRTAQYEYHRLGLDVMNSDAIKARAVISEAIDNLQEIHSVKPLSFSMQVFTLAKSAELINIYSKATIQEKNRIVPILKKIDPSNSNKYQEIKK